VPELDFASIDRALSDRSVDAIVHLAASGVHPAERDVDTLIRVNTLLPGCLVRAAAKAGVRAVVIAGTCAEYRGPAVEPLREEAPLESRKLYGATKAAGGMLALAQAAAADLPVAIVRLFNVYGANEAPHRLLPTLIRYLKAGTPVPISEGSQIRDFVHVDDVCRGLRAVLPYLIDRSMDSGFYNLATGIGTTVAEFARQVARCMDADERLLAFGTIRMRPDEVSSIVGDASALRSACGWQPSYSLKDGIAQAVSNSLQ
jgi:nucleoside-diphosphate-sugar epimerase